MRTEKCEHCKYWDIFDPINDKHNGWCLRNSPIAVFGQFIEDVLRENTNYSQGVWPITYDISWCGEFQSIAPNINTESIGILDLPIWVHTRLWNEGITTIGELTKYDKSQLMKIHRFGEGSLCWVQRRLLERNLYLRGKLGKSKITEENERKAEIAVREALGIS